MKLVITEKPSVGAAIASVIGAGERRNGYLEGNGYLVSWCIGHLFEPCDPTAYDDRYAKWSYEDLPIIPEQWQYRIDDKKKAQFKILRSLMARGDVDELICATDAGREGELIFRITYEQAGCEKPFKRLWISSMEEAAIREGFARLRDGADYDPLYQSALCRSKADWLVGMNGTRLFSCLYRHPLRVGRVQTPTLAMVVERDARIAAFTKEKYFQVRLNCGDFEAVSEKMANEADAKTIMAACDGQQAIIDDVQSETKTVNPPRLYDLTALQRDANRLYGCTAQQTLDIAQKLYEQKLLTYPRTDSRFITADMADNTRALAEICAALFAPAIELQPDTARIVNDKKVSDHHALLPTASISSAALEALTTQERNILTLVALRLLCAVADKHVYEATRAALTCEGSAFTASGKTVTQEGWKRIEALLKTASDPDEAGDSDESKELPPLAAGQAFSNIGAAVTEHWTAPPKHYTEDTLLAAMETAGNDALDNIEEVERKGLGTTATRAGILEKLVSGGYIERKKKSLIATDKGVKTITVLPDLLKSPKMTAEWENALTEIAKGAYPAGEFMAGIEELTQSLVATYHAVSDDDKKLFANADKPLVGSCPRCGADVYESKQNYYCANKDCAFRMWKNDKFFADKKKVFSAPIARALLARGRVKVNGLYSAKADKCYSAVVVLADTGDKYVNYKLEFPDRKNRQKQKGAEQSLHPCFPC